MSQPSVLIVEDEAVSAKIMQYQLEALGYSVPAICEFGEKAVQVIEEVHPQLVLMDIMLKGRMDGIETAREIQNRFDVPVIFTTALADDATLGRAMEATPAGYMLKPFAEDELRATIQLAFENHRLRTKMKETKRWLTAVMKNIRDGVVSTDQQGLITYMNSSAEAITGIAERDALGKDAAEVLSFLEEMVTSEVHPIRKVLVEKSPMERSSEVVLISGKGLGIPVHRNITSIVDEKGAPCGAVLVLRDRNEEIGEQSSAREHESPYEVAARQMGQIIYDLDMATGTASRWGAITEITGYEPEAFHEQMERWQEQIHPDDRDRTIEAYERASREEGRFVSEYRLRKKDGTYTFIEDTGIFLKDETGRMVRMFGLMKDVTERKLSEEMLRSNERRFRSVFDHSVIGLAITFPGGHFIKANGTFCRILGYSEEELATMSLVSIIHPEDAEKDSEATRCLLAGETEVNQLRMRCITKDKRAIPTVMTRVLICSEHKRPVYFIIQIQD